MRSKLFGIKYWDCLCARLIPIGQLHPVFLSSLSFSLFKQQPSPFLPLPLPGRITCMCFSLMPPLPVSGSRLSNSHNFCGLGLTFQGEKSKAIHCYLLRHLDSSKADCPPDARHPPSEWSYSAHTDEFHWSDLCS